MISSFVLLQKRQGPLTRASSTLPLSSVLAIEGHVGTAFRMARLKGLTHLNSAPCLPCRTALEISTLL